MQVSIKFVNLPGPQSSGKYGSIVTTDGTKIMVPADMLPQFRSGMSCEIATKAQTWGQGTDREAQVIIATSGPQQGYAGSTGPVQGQGVAGGYHGTPSRETGQRANTGFRPTVYQGGAGMPAQGGPASVDQARQIFVTGCVGRALGSGKFAASEIPVLTQAACEAYDRVLSAPAHLPGKPVEEPPQPELGDPGPEMQ